MTIRVVLPAHLRTLANVGSELDVDVPGAATQRSVLDALEEHRNGMFSMLLTAFKVPLVTAAYEEAELLRETGFDRPDLIARRDLKRKP